MSQNAFRAKHIAFFSIPAHGHVNPGLGLVTELVKRGHRVTYAVNEDFVAQVQEAGAVPVRYESTLPASDKGEEWPEDQATAMELFLAEARAVVPQIEAAYAGDRPDVIVYDPGATFIPGLAETWGVPCIQLSPTHVAFEGRAGRRCGWPPAAPCPSCAQEVRRRTMWGRPYALGSARRFEWMLPGSGMRG